MITARTLGPALAVLGLAGCTLLLGYGEEATLAPAGDSGAVGSEAGGSSGGPAGDGATGGSTDASDDRPFCDRLTPKPTFCASFDGPSLLSEWPESFAKNVRLDRDTTSFVSPPAALSIAYDRVEAGGVSGGAGVTFTQWENKPLSATIGFDLQVEAAAPAGALAVIATPLFYAVSWGANYLIQLVARPLVDGTTVGLTLTEVTNDPSAVRDHVSTVPLQMGQWAHVDLTLVVPGATPGSARLVIDGRVAFEGSLQLTGTGTPCTSFGLATVGPETTAWAYRFDNVTLDLRDP